MEYESLHEDVISAGKCDQSFIISENSRSMSISAEESEMSILEGLEDDLGDDNLEGDLEDDNLEGDLEDDLTNLLEDDLDDILEEVDASFPNEAYGDLMALVTKHKLNNASGNAIIKFFNKHANLTTSPLPKSIKQGREYMDNMNLPNLIYYKTCVKNYNKKEYYLHHRSLLSCIKNILSIPDISQNFALDFEKLEVIIYSINADS
jgi:hypothetical protein